MEEIVEILEKSNYNILNWEYISCHSVLSETFIDRFQNKLNWELISRYQTLTENFIKEHKSKVYWPLIFRNQILSKSFIEEYEKSIYIRIKNKIFAEYQKASL